MLQGAERLEGLKEYYFSRKLKEIQSLRDSGHDVINLGIGSPDLPPHHSVIEAISISAAKPENHGYRAYNGSPDLRESIVRWLKRVYDLSEISPSHILPLMGSKEGILHVNLAFANPNDEVLVPELGYPAYRSIGEMLGLKVKTYPLNDKFHPNFKWLEENGGNAKILWCNYPHMPTGTAATNEIFDQLIDFGNRHQVLIAHDNPYSLVLNNNPLSLPSRPGALDIAIELNSLSKSHHMAGWRIGWAAGNEVYIERILKIKSNIDSGMFRGIEESAIAALSLTDSYHQSINQQYKERQTNAFELLKSLNCQFDPNQTGMFVWGKLPEGYLAEDFCEKILKDNHIFITPGSLFGESGKSYIRVSLCVTTDRIYEANERIKNG